MKQIFHKSVFLASQITTFLNYFIQMFSWRDGVLLSRVRYWRSTDWPFCFIVPMLLSLELGRK